MERIIVSSQEVADATLPAAEGPPPQPKLRPAIPWWGRVLCALLVPALPLLCLATIVLRIAFRNQPPRTRFAWTSYLATLLMISGMLNFTASVLIISFVPVPAIVSAALGDLDERNNFPALPAEKPLTGTEVSQQLKPLVAVLSPAQHRWFSHEDVPSAGLGAGVLLQANASGYLFATAKHVAAEFDAKKKTHILVAMASGIWATGDIVAHHETLDLALVWVPRTGGKSEFVQPVTASKDIVEGSPVYVIGHPEGLRYSLSTGIIARLRGTLVQVTAPVSPGNSGGPVFDDRGNLVGIVSSTMDKSIVPNAENLGFAVQADALLHQSGWRFSPQGEKQFKEYSRALADKSSAAPMAPAPAVAK